MQRLLLTTATVATFLIATPATSVANGEVWQLDTDHSSVAFTARHLKLTKVRGTFDVPTGTFNVRPENFAKSNFDVAIDASSINTKVAKRDGHLKSDAFFNVEKHPKITFKSTKIKGKKGAYTMTGDLALAGVTKPATFSCETVGPFKGVFGTTRFAMECTAKINRHDWKMSWNQVVEGLKLVGDDIEIEVSMQFAHRKPKKDG